MRGCNSAEMHATKRPHYFARERNSDVHATTPCLKGSREEKYVKQYFIYMKKIVIVQEQKIIIVEQSNTHA